MNPKKINFEGIVPAQRVFIKGAIDTLPDNTIQAECFDISASQNAKGEIVLTQRYQGVNELKNIKFNIPPGARNVSEELGIRVGTRTKNSKGKGINFSHTKDITRRIQKDSWFYPNKREGADMYYSFDYKGLRYVLQTAHEIAL